MTANAYPRFLTPVAISILLVGCGPSPGAAAPSTNRRASSHRPAPRRALEAPGKRDPGVIANCTAWSTRTSGPFRYTNDQWGSSKSKQHSNSAFFTERGPMVKRLAGLGTGQERSTVFAYPSATFGWKPSSGGEPTDSRLPILVSNLHQLDLQIGVDLRATGSYNLAAELWFIKSLPAGWGAQPGLITHEVMFWLEEVGAEPAGRPIDNPTITGVNYELWRDDGMGKDANGVGWTILYHSRRPTTVGTAPSPFSSSCSTSCNTSCSRQTNTSLVSSSEMNSSEETRHDLGQRAISHQSTVSTLETRSLAAAIEPPAACPAMKLAKTCSRHHMVLPSVRPMTR